MLNLIRLLGLFSASCLIYPFKKELAVYNFLKVAGPPFIKLGQVLSVRPDLVGTKIATTLSSFQDRLQPCSNKRLQKILQEEFRNFSDIFADFDFNAVASASIAQVHKAKLKDGRVVAVKILRPQIEKIMARDISSLKILIKFLAFFSKFLAKSFSDIVDLLSDLSRSELDLIHEAANASRLKEELKEVKGFYVPEIFWKYSSSKILVLEWIDGIAFSNKAEIAATNFDKKQIAQNLVISYFTQVYSNGFFHADMHPGNLFLMKNGDIGVVDFGIMGKIDKKTRLAVAEILIGFLHKDYQRVAQLHIDAGLVPPLTKVDDLAISCRKIGEMIVGSDVRDISVAKLLSDLIIMTRQYQMETRGEILLLQKTLLLVEGVGVTLDPELNIWDLARPWVKEWAKKNISFDAKIRDTMVELFELARKFLRSI